MEGDKTGGRKKREDERVRGGGMEEGKKGREEKREGRKEGRKE